MKKFFVLLAVMMMEMSTWAATAVKPETGDGTSESPYVIATVGNLVWFANEVNSGNTSICGKLTADIDMDSDPTMIGRGEGGYAGTFDGGGHTVTVNYTATNDYTALFRDVCGATIQNLRTAGYITTSCSFAAGIISNCSGNTTVSRCESSVVITASYSTDTYANHGGIVALCNGNLTLNACVFDGQMLNGTSDVVKVQGCSGLVGWVTRDQKVTVSGCLFNPSAPVTFDADKAYTLAQGVLMSDITITDCYYTTAFGTAQGTQVTSDAVTSGELCYNMNSGKTDGTQVWYQNINNGKEVDASPVPFSSHGTVYDATGYCMTPHYSNVLTAHAIDTQFDANGEKVCSVCHKVIEYQEPELSDDTYLLANRGNLIMFANMVNAGETAINGTLTADIDMGSDQTMIGTEDKEYSGTIDGQFHTVTVNYNTTEQFTALFRYVKGATIRNLLTAGTITTSKEFAAGVIACCDGVILNKVLSSVTINSSLNGASCDAGLVAHIRAASTIKECGFTGKLLGENSSVNGGLAGYVLCENVTITDSYAYVTEQTTKTDNSFTIACYNQERYAPTITNCYYVPSLSQYKEMQGTEVSAENAEGGALCYMMDGYKSTGSFTWYQNLGTDIAPVCDSSHGIVYYGEDACPETKQYSNVTHSFPSGISGLISCTNEGCSAVTDVPEFDEATNSYLLEGTSDFNWFVKKVNNGATTLNATLRGGLELSDNKMIGTADFPYAGTFNGANNTVTINYNITSDGAALFRYVSGARISHLNVAGSITTSGKAVAGLICYCDGAEISDCASSVTIQTTNAYCHAGGIVEEVLPSLGSTFSGQTQPRTTTIKNCLFNGSFGGEFTTSTGSTACAGIAGYVYSDAGHVNIENCLCVFTSQAEAPDSHTFADGSNYDLTHCYYLTAMGIAQGTQVTAGELSSGELCYRLNSNNDDNATHWFESLGIEAIPYPLNTHAIVLVGPQVCPYIPSKISYSNTPHSLTGEKTGCDGYYHAACSVDGCAGYYEYEKPEYDSQSDCYKIKNKGNLCWFSQWVGYNKGKANARLMNDIDMTDVNWTPIGWDVDNAFTGTFDGQGYRIKNLKIAATASHPGLFCTLGNGAIIKNTIIDSSCSYEASTNVTGIGGIAGCVESVAGSTCIVYIQNCGNEASINGGANVAGILGGVYTNEKAMVYIQNCYNSGNIKGVSKSATLCGFAKHNYSFTNCYNTGSISGGNKSDGIFYTHDSDGSHYVANCYDINDSYGSGVTKISSTDATLGALCNNLNANRGEMASWTQDLESDAHPTLGDAGLHYTRIMANQWGTICLPFAVETGSDYDFYKLSDVSENTIILTKVNALEAGTPAIVRRNAAATGIDVPAIGTTIATTPLDDSSAKLLLILKGSYETENINNMYGYIIANNAFWNINQLDNESDIHCAPFHAWLSGVVEGARSLNIRVDDATGIDLTPALSQGEGELNGRSATEETLGLSKKFIVNGRLVIIKNGIEYNATGQKIKL